MANSVAVLKRAGLGILADNDDDPGTVPLGLTGPQDSSAPSPPAPGRPSNDFECFLADLKREVEQPILSAMALALRTTLSRLARRGES